MGGVVELFPFNVVDVFTDGMVVVVAFSSLASIKGECSTIHSPPALFFNFFFKFN